MAAKTALVTGGSRGIGRGIVLALPRRGWHVAFSYRSDAAAAEETVAGHPAAGGSAARVRAVQADTSQPDDREQLVQAALAVERQDRSAGEQRRHGPAQPRRPARGERRKL